MLQRGRGEFLHVVPGRGFEGTELGSCTLETLFVSLRCRVCGLSRPRFTRLG